MPLNDMQIRRAGELAVLRYDAEQNGMQEDNDVHRENADTDPEAAAALERIARMAESIQNEDSVQKTFNRQMGGQAAMKMANTRMYDFFPEKYRALNNRGILRG